MAKAPSAQFLASQQRQAANVQRRGLIRTDKLAGSIDQILAQRRRMMMEQSKSKPIQKQKTPEQIARQAKAQQTRNDALYAKYGKYSAEEGARRMLADETARRDARNQQRTSDRARVNFPYGMAPNVWKRYDYTSRVPKEAVHALNTKVGADMSIQVPSLPTSITKAHAAQYATGFRNTQKRALQGHNKKAMEKLMDFNEAVKEMKASAIEMALAGTKSKKIDPQSRADAVRQATKLETQAQSIKSAKGRISARGVALPYLQKSKDGFSLAEWQRKKRQGGGVSKKDLAAALVD